MKMEEKEVGEQWWALWFKRIGGERMCVVEMMEENVRNRGGRR